MCNRFLSVHICTLKTKASRSKEGRIPSPEWLALLYCKADFKSIAKCKKWLCAAVFVLLFKVARRAANPVLQSRCNGFSAPPQNIPKTTKTGRKSVGFLILTWVLKYTRSHRFPPQKHPKNGFVMRFAGKNSFFQLRARDFSFYMNTHTFLLRRPFLPAARPFVKFCAGWFRQIKARPALSAHCTHGTPGSPSH